MFYKWPEWSRLWWESPIFGEPFAYETQNMSDTRNAVIHTWNRKYDQIVWWKSASNWSFGVKVLQQPTQSHMMNYCLWQYGDISFQLHHVHALQHTRSSAVLALCNNTTLFTLSAIFFHSSHSRVSVCEFHKQLCNDLLLLFLPACATNTTAPFYRETERVREIAANVFSNRTNREAKKYTTHSLNALSILT